MQKKVDIDSYVVYTSNGETYHRRPACATQPEIPTKFDKAASAFDRVKSDRVGNVGHDTEDYCKKCCGDILREL